VPLEFRGEAGLLLGLSESLLAEVRCGVLLGGHLATGLVEGIKDVFRGGPRSGLGALQAGEFLLEALDLLGSRRDALAQVLRSAAICLRRPWALAICSVRRLISCSPRS